MRALSITACEQRDMDESEYGQKLPITLAAYEMW